MDGTVIFPSPNWFQVSILAVSKDGWLIYGAPSKGLCVLEPIQDEPGPKKENRFQAHVLNRAHLEKIISVDISPAWPEKKLFLTGCADGSVKQWGLEKVQGGTKIKALHLLDLHQIEKENLVGVAYSSESFVITVGTFGNIVKWDLRSNVAKTYKKFMAKFKPTCMSCSPHAPLNVAVGTKQGVVFVLDLEGHGKILYKVRALDNDIVNVSWCPQYQVVIKKSLQEKSVKKSNLADRLERIRSEDSEQSLNDSGVVKNLPDDSFDETIVEEDDTFDIYKDHEADEFGHKKYEPKDILVKVKVEKEPDDFLTECLKLKEDILKMKNESEQTVDNLVESLDNTHIDNDTENTEPPSPEKKQPPSKTSSERIAFSSHVQKHLLAVLGKHGGVKLLSKGGKIVSSGVLPKANKTFCTTVLWYAPDVLLCADGKSQLLQCNPLSIDCEKKLCFEVVHSLHKRGLSCIATNAPRVQAEEPGEPPREQWRVWTVAQERNLICYSVESRETVSVHHTAGSFLYTVQSCPYDARSVAISSGDGAVRVWETDTLEEDDSKLSPGKVTLYWQNVQGKVLTVAWHPTKENLLAFSTGESRVGLIKAHAKAERSSARTLAQAQLGAVYSLCWGDSHDLYACGNGKLVVYRADKPDEDPTPITVELEGKKLELSCVCWDARGMLCGSANGAVTALEPRTRELLAASFVFSKMIHMTEWHPLQTSSASDESPYKDLIAVSSLDKSCNVAIVQYADKGDGPKLHKWKMLSGHKSPVLQVAWNPHKDAQLLSTSHDATVRVWDASEGVCVAIFGGHAQTSLSAAWSAFPQLSSTVLSGGGDCCLRVWRVEDYPPRAYTEFRHEIFPKKKKATLEEKEETEEKKEEQQDECDADVTDVATSASKSKAARMFLLPTVQRPIWQCTAESLRIMAAKYLNGENNQDIKSVISENGDNAQETKHINQDNGEQNQEKKCVISVNGENGHEISENEIKSDDGMKTNEVLKPDDAEISDDTKDLDKDGKAKKPMYVEYWKLFGSTNEFNEILDLEMRRHEEFGRLEAWSMLAILRGHIDAVVQFASQRDALCPFLLSISPCVSFKYWKDVTQLYLAQIERLAAKGEEDKMNEAKAYGGSVFRRAALLLSVHDARGAAAVLREARLFAEAYVLARARHMDSLAREVLQAWIADSMRRGHYQIAAVCHLALGEPSSAAEVLANLRKLPEFLGLAAELAKAAGQLTFAAHVEEKKSELLSQTHDADASAEEHLKPLPSKIDLMRDTIEIQDAADCDTEQCN